MSTRDDMIVLYQDRYLKKCEQVSDLREELRRLQFLIWMLGLVNAALLVILIWG